MLDALAEKSARFAAAARPPPADPGPAELEGGPGEDAPRHLWPPATVPLAAPRDRLTADLSRKCPTPPSPSHPTWSGPAARNAELGETRGCIFAGRAGPGRALSMVKEPGEEEEEGLTGEMSWN